MVRILVKKLKSKPSRISEFFEIFALSSLQASSKIRRFLRSVLLMFRTKLLESELSLLLYALRHRSEQNFLSDLPIIFSPHSKHSFMVEIISLILHCNSFDIAGYNSLRNSLKIIAKHLQFSVFLFFKRTKLLL